MKFSFKSASCVVVGTFNIYIIQPRFLIQMGLLDETAKVKLQSDFSQPGIRMEIESQTWSVRPERISIESLDPECDCGRPIAQLLEKLIWTPTMAVGVNVVFSGDSSLESVLPDGFQLPQSDSLDLIQRTCHAAIRQGEQVLNAQLAKTDDGIELSLNVHTEIAKTGSQLELNELAQNVCRTFFDQRQQLTSFATKLLNDGEFTYDAFDGN